MTEQEQRGGLGSTNVQIGTITTGLSYAEVRDIANDLFQQNFSKLAKVAHDTAFARAEKIREEIIKKLEENPRADPNVFSQVEKQVSILEAQRSYAISGDENLKDILVKAVVGISTAPERSKKSIVLGEAIKVAPMLTPDQLRALGISFMIMHVRFHRSTLAALFQSYIAIIKLDVPNIELSIGDLRHLEYLGCGTVGIGQHPFCSILGSHYPGLISAGYTSEEVSTAFAPDSVPPILFNNSRRNRNNFQPTFQGEDFLKHVYGLTPHQMSVAARLVNERPIDEPTLKAKIHSLPGNAGYLYDRWATSNLHHFQLTSVGIAIGHTVVCQTEALPDIDGWL